MHDHDQQRKHAKKVVHELIRLTGKMMNSSWNSTTTTPPQPQKDNPNVKKLEDNTNNNIDSSTIRVCSDCNTTKTPLWRSGPRGPKSLCNACGIRQRKARRRAMAAAAANVTSEKSTKNIAKVQNKEKPRHDQYLLPYNKRFRDDINYNNNNDHHHHHGINKDHRRFEDFFINLSKKLAFHSVFPKDEEEAAILLMAISSGLVHG